MLLWLVLCQNQIEAQVVDSRYPAKHLRNAVGLLSQLIVFLVRHGLQPLVGRCPRTGVLHCYVGSDVLKPRVFLCAMPVLYALGNVDYVARKELHGRLAPLLIPSFARDADENLASTVVDMPIIAAAWFKGDIAHGLHRLLALGQVFRCQGSQIAVAHEVLGVCRVGLADGEGQVVALAAALCGRGGIILPHLFGLIEGRPSLGPSSVEGRMGDNLGNLCARDAIFAGLTQVKGERTVGDTLADERRDGDETAVAQPQKVVSTPHLTKKDVVVEVCKLWRKLTQLGASCRLYYFLLCHN